MNSGPESAASPIKPKLYTCYRTNQEAWSSTGSRQSSRPGSSASSRPPSQCNNAYNGTGGNANNLYSRSTNSSLSDVSVARNFQQLSVSTRRAAFKTQKWSHSFDQGNNQILSSSPSGHRRRQTSLHQKSLDLDSGYLGSSTGDLKSCYSQSNDTSSHVLGVCSPIVDARQELRELLIKQETVSNVISSPAATNITLIPAPEDDNDLSRSTSLPSFPESFQPTNCYKRSGLPVVESAGDLTVNEDDNNLDEEIKMIVALGENTSSNKSIDDDMLTFLTKHCPLPSDVNDIQDQNLFHVINDDEKQPELHRPEPVKQADSDGHRTMFEGFGSPVKEMIRTKANQGKMDEEEQQKADETKVQKGKIMIIISS